MASKTLVKEGLGHESLEIFPIAFYIHNVLDYGFVLELKFKLTMINKYQSYDWFKTLRCDSDMKINFSN